MCPGPESTTRTHPAAPAAAPDPHGHGTRYLFIDVLRGSAIALMILYHFCFDLDYFGFASFDFNNDPLWLGFRAFIVSMFLGLVGVSLWLSTRRGINPRSYLRRLALLVLYAGLASTASYLLYPDSMIFFGILHFITVASVLGLLFRGFYWLNLALGVILIVLPWFFSHPFFDQTGLQWVGLMTHKPHTEDYVPLIPWFGVVLLGLFAGRDFFSREPLPAVAGWHSSHRAARVLAFGGRHSIHIYILHQPVLMGVLYVVARLADHQGTGF
ncbi:MAG: DUF1624 domain-containing protein [Pseudomonadota bacterium]|nr:MAG: DUF1624 domain-containing protein [Pseudomonadota bacterium]